MHRILERQIKQHLGGHAATSAQWKAFFESISRVYMHLDEDRLLLNRSLDLSSKEFRENNRRVEEAKLKVEEQAKNLALEVAKRTRELHDRLAELEDARKAMTNLLEDLSEEKIKTDVLTKDLEKFKLAVDNATDQIIISDAEGIVIYGNRSIEKNTGFKVDQMLGKKVGALWKKPMPSAYYKNLWNTIKKQKKTFTSEIENRRSNGEVYTASISITPILDQNGNIEFFVGIERDITKEKELEHLKDDFVNIAAHDLRTPATVIKGYLSMVLEGDGGQISDKVRALLAQANEGNERLIHLINDFLNVSRFERGKIKIQPQSLDLNELAEKLSKDFSLIAKTKGLTVQHNTMQLPKVWADSERVIECLGNLLDNAIKFTNNGGITISHEVKDGSVITHVTDTGVGILMGAQENLFRKFFRAGTGKSQSGLGLGLYICRLIIEDSGGKIWAKSQEGTGSTFSFSLPVVK